MTDVSDYIRRLDATQAFFTKQIEERDNMPWAIFHRDYDHDFRPERAVCQTIRSSHEPQQWPEKVIAAAVKAGAAERVNSPTATEKRARKRVKRAE